MLLKNDIKPYRDFGIILNNHAALVWYFVTNCTIWTHYSVLYMYICDPGEQNSLMYHGYICSNSQKYSVWIKMIHFYFMSKIIRILSKYVPWIYIGLKNKPYIVAVIYCLYVSDFWLLFILATVIAGCLVYIRGFLACQKLLLLLIWVFLRESALRLRVWMKHTPQVFSAP